MPFNICILTFNESKNIVDCLDSCPKESKIYIIDSMSSDNTLELVRKYDNNITIIENEWLGFGEQRNLIQMVSLKFTHTLFIDADERLNQDLIDELIYLLNKDLDVVYKLYHKNFFKGKFLRHQRENRSGQIRFGKNDLMQFLNVGHGQDVKEKTICSIKTSLPHYPMSKGVNEWISKHVGYAIKEAEGQGKLAYRLPFWPELVFLNDFILRAGFLDGVQGFMYLSLKYNYYRNIRLLRKINRFE